MGVTGAGTATVTGRGIGVLYLFWVRARGQARLRVSRAKHCDSSGDAMRRILRVSLAGMLQFAIGATVGLR